MPAPLNVAADLAERPDVSTALACLWSRTGLRRWNQGGMVLSAQRACSMLILRSAWRGMCGELDSQRAGMCPCDV